MAPASAFPAGTRRCRFRLQAGQGLGTAKDVAQSPSGRAEQHRGTCEGDDPDKGRPGIEYL